MTQVADRIGLEKGDITTCKVEAIVNAANSSLRGGGGVDGAIHRAGGAQILADCKLIVANQGPCKPGNAVITSAGVLSALYVIHAVGPVWQGGDYQESEVLANAYRNALKLATEQGCISVAFPNISTGIYGYPKKEAAEIAFTEVRRHLRRFSVPEKVIFVCFDNENYGIYRSLLSS